ncbi:sex comb on midleg-like protein 4 [Strigops habroptila]|uniref:Scm polycomb group protein like 4 n=1 Tax=Strigops habroptila TaxID=2489341 RepID=A0A672U0V7_STRHB|nr:sex comb on midleg-like protein 4 [Strigops habroptila]XP_030346402.1 sex comb on midleg-like protein 4 [Strigops habroptila]XP_030346403.1 sex comb on midleg-like protein 4 [Strigops habroptila]
MSHLPCLPASLAPGEMQSPRMAGRKRGRPPLQPAPIKVAVHNLYSAPAAALPVVKIPKKRGRKPGYKLKSRVLMTPLAVSPPRSTPEPDISSIPQDAATIPNSATPQALTVCIYVNKQANLGPYLDRKKVQQLPEHFGPERPSAALQQAVQACIDCALQQKVVFSLIKQGYGGEMVSVSASFEGKQHLMNVLVVNSIGYVLRFLKKLCRSLLCDNLFSNQPFQQYNAVSESPEVYENRRVEAETFTPEDYVADPANMKRYSMDPADSAFSCMGSMYSLRQSPADGRPAGGSSSSCSHRPAQMSSGGSSSTGLHHQTSSPTRNGTYLEGNRSASSPSPEQQDTTRPSSKNPLTWTVDDVVWFVKDADPHALGPHVELFRKHEIDGNALLLLKSDMIMKYLGLKLGPALKLCYHIDKLKQAKF